MPFVEEFLLAADDRFANPDDGLLALLDILDELNGGGKAFLHVVAHLARGAVFTQHAPVVMAKAKLGKAVLVQNHLIAVTGADEGNIRLNQARL